MVDKEYKIKINHKIFGISTMKCEISGCIDDENRYGFIVHGKEIYCCKNHKTFNIVNKNDMLIIADDLMEIFIYI